ncbi:MAG: STAS domain-containing protein [Jannaschia helgolandensis]|uniref:Anti-sigma B factor antagonist n=1 Tax=Jannaschia helgolandensis TaxID=188906 RepID=A0A1H7HJP1_9RHOB|nr:STAS domain-containing protein [Jannaschia helgolandensis]SEK49857.1 anti-sigma B factor antagonist [Jannaschia helgolandensis]|tara:strand:+ start:213 stop:548 length:336 start_codon:yes stop_codon:yes gene_type:complete
MKIERRIADDLLILTLQDTRIDAAGAVPFKEAVRQMVQDFDDRVMIDMTRIEFLDSSGLGALVAIMKMLGGARRLELANCGTIVRKVLTLTRMDSVFILHDAAPTAGRSAA